MHLCKLGLKSLLGALIKISLSFFKMIMNKNSDEYLALMTYRDTP